jgi:hypothetical protein
MLEANGRQVQCLAELCHQRREGDWVHHGVRLATEAGRAALLDTYLRCRFPNLQLRGQIDPARVWELFARSGYFALRDGTAPGESWFTAPDTEAISRDVCYRASDSSVIGHVSSTRAYSRAWLGHQLALLNGHPETAECRETIYLHIGAFPLLMDGKDALLFGYFNSKKRWHQIYFSGFVDWVGSPSVAVLGVGSRNRRRIALPSMWTVVSCPAAISAPLMFITSSGMLRASPSVSEAMSALVMSSRGVRRLSSMKRAQYC